MTDPRDYRLQYGRHRGQRIATMPAGDIRDALEHVLADTLPEDVRDEMRRRVATSDVARREAR